MESRMINPYSYWLSSIKGVGDFTIRALMNSASSVEEIYYMPEKEIRAYLSGIFKKESCLRRISRP